MVVVHIDFKKYAVWNLLQNNPAGQERICVCVCVHRLQKVVTC